MTHPILTKQYLKSYKPCEGDFKAWCQLFPDGMALTKRNWQKIVDSGIDYLWLSDLLTAPARDEYEKNIALALAEYHKITALAWAEYNKITDPAWAEYEKITDPALLVALRKSIKE